MRKDCGSIKCFSIYRFSFQSVSAINYMTKYQAAALKVLGHYCGGGGCLDARCACEV